MNLITFQSFVKMGMMGICAQLVLSFKMKSMKDKESMDAQNASNYGRIWFEYLGFLFLFYFISTYWLWSIFENLEAELTL